MSSSVHQLPSVLIVGGGIGGLVLAVHLSKAGHPVRVIEQKAEYTETNCGGGLSLSRNATRFIFALDLQDEFEKIADLGTHMTIIRASDGAVIQKVPEDGRYKVHRYDLLQVLARSAKTLGVAISMGCSVQSLVEENDGVTAELSTGEKVSASILVGADGVHSKVRKHLLADQKFEPQLTGHCTFLLDVPKSVMEGDPSTRDLYRNGVPFYFHMGELSTVISWTMSHRDVYHLQVNDHGYGTGSRYGVDDTHQKQFVSSVNDLDAFRQRFSDYGGALKVIYSQATKVTKWLIAELPDLPAWSSKSGRIILLGDAAHCFPPYAGQGSCMAIEDAAVLAELLGKDMPRAWSPKTIADSFEQVRRPRIERVKATIRGNIARWSGVKEEATMTEAQLAQQAADSKWIKEYDAVEEARQYVLQRNS